MIGITHRPGAAVPPERVRRGWIGLAVVAAVLMSACTGADGATTTTLLATTNPTTTPPTSMPSTTVTTTPPAPGGTVAFDIPVGVDGITYLVDGDPPSGPSSFVVLNDGSVVVADTMAVLRGAPQLLHFAASGTLITAIDLADAEVASVVDVVSDGTSLIILDVLASMNRYRVLFLSLEGSVESSVDLPAGYHFPDGLTGLLVDDDGLMLEFEFGARYARVSNGAVETIGATPVYHGRDFRVTEVGDRQSQVDFGAASWTIDRSTDLGGVTLVGVGETDIVLVLDEVDFSGVAVDVSRRVQRYTHDGEFVSEIVLDAGEQHVEIARPLEVGSRGEVVYLLATPEAVQVIPDPSSTSAGIGA